MPPVTSLPLAETDRHLPRIVRFVEDLEATTVGSRTEEEDLHLGLDAAMRMRFRHGARQAVIVIGDAAAHRRAQMQTLFRAEGFARKVEHRTISTLFVTTPNSLRHGQRGRPFFQKLADAG